MSFCESQPMSMQLPACCSAKNPYSMQDYADLVANCFGYLVASCCATQIQLYLHPEGLKTPQPITKN